METVPNFKTWIMLNMGQNMPVSHDDVNLMVEMVGKEVSTLQGESVKPKPPVINKCKIVEIPRELEMKGKKIEITIDLVYIND